jgi:hypothetical protein
MELEKQSQVVVESGRELLSQPVLEGVDLNTKAPEVEQVHSFEEMQG